MEHEEPVVIRLAASAGKGIENNYIAASTYMDLANYDVYYYAECLSGQGKYGASQGNLYRRLNASQTFVLSQGKWKIDVICVPRSPSNPNTLQPPFSVSYIAGSSGEIHVNLETKYIYILLNDFSNYFVGTTGTLDIDSYRVLGTDGITVSYDLMTIQGMPVPQTNTYDETTTAGGYTVFRDKEELSPGLYILAITSKKDNGPAFTDLRAFAIRPGCITTITGLCETLSEADRFEPTPVPQEPPEAGGTIPGNTIIYNNTNQNPEATQTNNLDNIQPGYIYLVENPPQNMPHSTSSDSSTDRIVLGETGTETGRYGIDLHGGTLRLRRSETGDNPESMRVATVRENQTLSLYNAGNNDSSIFGSGSWDMGVIRYDSAISVEGGVLFCAPEGYSTKNLTISGPMVGNKAYALVDGQYVSYMKQGAINIAGVGGDVRLNSPYITIGEQQTVKGITSYTYEDGYTSLNPGAKVDISVTNGVKIDATPDNNDDTHAQSANRAEIQQQTHGIDTGAGIYITGETKTGTHRTNADVDITLSSGSSIAVKGWGDSKQELASVGVYVGFIEGPVDISLDNVSISTVSNGHPNGADPDACTSAGVMLENVVGPVNLTLSGNTRITGANGGTTFHYPIYIKDCPASNGSSINITLDDTTLKSNRYCIMLDNCGADININITSRHNGEDPLQSPASMWGVAMNDMYIRNCTGTIRINGVVYRNGKFNIN